MIGRRIKMLRDERHLSQEKLASVLGVSRMTVNNYENEKRAPDIDFARHIADYFGVTVEFLMGRTEYRYKRDIKVSLERAEKLFRIMEKLPQPDIQEMVSSLIGALEKAADTELAEDIVHVLNYCCMNIRGMLCEYESLQSEIVNPVAELKHRQVPIDQIRLAVRHKPSVICGSAFHASNMINDELKACANNMQKKLEHMVEEELRE